jgi:hypothetical protein
MRLISLALFLLWLPFTATAQSSYTENGIPLFETYDDAIDLLDEFMSQRRIADMMDVFFGVPDSQSRPLEAQLRAVTTQNYKNVDTVLRTETAPGWTQEVRAYWTGQNYVFVAVMVHEQEDGFLVLDVLYNTSWSELRRAM